MKKLLLILVFGFFVVSFSSSVFAKECNEGNPHEDSLCRRRQKLEGELGQLITAIAGAKESLGELESQIKNIQSSINQAKLEINQMEGEIVKGEGEIESQKRLLFAKVRDLYIQGRKLSVLNIFLASQNFSQALKQYNYLKVAGEQDKKIIKEVGGKINNLNKSKVSLEKIKVDWQSIEQTLDKEAGKVEKDIQGATVYEGELNEKIENIKAEQARILAEKTGLFQTSVGDTPPVDDPCSGSPGASNFCSPGFSPAFGLFSFGSPHRKGMSQYGAYGRSKNGQNYEQILKAYYGNIRIETVSSPGSIATSVGSLPFEDNYLRGIAEMPSSWGEKGGMEALKAQAIAARTYALAWTGWRMGDQSVKKSICTTEACQVYSASKAGNPGASWAAAVEQTRGKIVVSNSANEIISTWYASTAGGYLYSYTTLGHSTGGTWDTQCNDQGCWPDQAWEKVSGSPWFYKAWYKTRSGKSCGRSHPWLNSEEMSDIVNALLVYKNDSSQSIHLSQTDDCWGSVPETWSKDQLREKAAAYGGPVSSVHSANVTYSSNGVTQEVRIGTDKGEFSFSGENFKTVFNLRVPGSIHLKSLLFNLVKI